MTDRSTRSEREVGAALLALAGQESVPSRALRAQDLIGAIPVLAALFHDVGKPQTTRRQDGRITSHGHAERGADLFRTMGRRLALPRPLVVAVAAIVETHMAHLSVRGEPTPKAVRRLRDRLLAAGTSLDEWGVVVRCDGEARGPAARPDASEPWRRVAGRLSRPGGLIALGLA